MKIKDKINQTIANNIKLARISAGITQEELARRTGYTDRSSIAKIECTWSNSWLFNGLR